jgi:hypothetical protein
MASHGSLTIHVYLKTNLIILVNSSPQIMLLSIYFDEYFIKKEYLTETFMSFFQAARINFAKFDTEPTP